MNPTIVFLEKYADQGGAVKLSGFVGNSGSEKIRLYQTLEMNNYVDIFRDAILHSEKISGDENGKISVYVLKSANVTVGQISTTTAGEAIHPLQQSNGGGTPGTRCAQYRQTIVTGQFLLRLLRLMGNRFGIDFSGSGEAIAIQASIDDARSKLQALGCDEAF